MNSHAEQNVDYLVSNEACFFLIFCIIYTSLGEGIMASSFASCSKIVCDFVTMFINLYLLKNDRFLYL